MPQLNGTRSREARYSALRRIAAQQALIQTQGAHIRCRMLVGMGCSPLIHGRGLGAHRLEGLSIVGRKFRWITIVESTPARVTAIELRAAVQVTVAVSGASTAGSSTAISSTRLLTLVILRRDRAVIIAFIATATGAPAAGWPTATPTTVSGQVGRQSITTEIRGIVLAITATTIATDITILGARLLFEVMLEDRRRCHKVNIIVVIIVVIAARIRIVAATAVVVVVAAVVCVAAAGVVIFVVALLYSGR